MRSHTKCFRRVSAFVSYVRLSYLGFCDHTDVARVAHDLFVYARASTTRVNRIFSIGVLFRGVAKSQAEVTFYTVSSRPPRFL